MHAPPSHCFRSWLSCNGSWRWYGPTFLPNNCWVMALREKHLRRRNLKTENNGEMLLCFLNVFCILIGSVCLAKFRTQKLKAGTNLEIWAATVKWLGRIKFLSSYQFKPIENPVILQLTCNPKEFLKCLHASFKSIRLNRGSKPASNQWSNSFKGVHGRCLNHSQSIFDFLSKNSQNKRRTADKTRFHDTAV